MATRPIWKGRINFGLVTIPVGLYSIVSKRSVAFNLLHKSCHTKIKEHRYCPHHKRDIEWNEVVRGFQYEKGKYVVFTEEDFEKLPIPSKHAVDIDSFVEKEDLDPIYFNQSYMLEPDEEGDKPYALLVKALEKKNLIGIAKIAIRDKEQLCALRPERGQLLLETLYFHDEIKFEPNKKAPHKVSEAELKLATSLIDMLKGPFEPEKYRDTYREAIMEMVQAKLKGKTLTAPKQERPAKVVDLMQALKASMERKGASKEQTQEARPKASSARSKSKSTAKGSSRAHSATRRTHSNHPAA